MLTFCNVEDVPITLAEWQQLYRSQPAGARSFDGDGTREIELCWVGIASDEEKVPCFWLIRIWDRQKRVELESHWCSNRVEANRLYRSLRKTVLGRRYG